MSETKYHLIRPCGAPSPQGEGYSGRAMNDEPKTCPRCHSPEVEEHCGGEPGGLPYWECLKCGLCWDGKER